MTQFLRRGRHDDRRNALQRLRDLRGRVDLGDARAPRRRGLRRCLCGCRCQGRRRGHTRRRRYRFGRRGSRHGTGRLHHRGRHRPPLRHVALGDAQLARRRTHARFLRQGHSPLLLVSHVLPARLLRRARHHDFQRGDRDWGVRGFRSLREGQGVTRAATGPPRRPVMPMGRPPHDELRRCRGDSSQASPA